MDAEWLLRSASGAVIALSGIFVITGVVLIRLGMRDHHRLAMLTACALAAVFVVLYAITSTLYPQRTYAGGFRSLYLSVLWSHTALSVVNLPLAVVTVYLALKKRFERHRKVAPFTAALWVYVAASGWLVFLFNG